MGPFKAIRRFLRNRRDFYRDYSSFGKGALRDDLIHFAEWFRLLRSEKAPIDMALPWITLPATNFLREVLQPGMKVFEWGCGGSTLFYASRGCEVTAIEHSLPWCDMVNGRLSAIQAPQCRIEYAPPDDGDLPTNPVYTVNTAVSYRSTNSDFEGKTFVGYSSKIDVYPDGFYDLIAIDGRARLSCLFHALKKVKLGGYILLDNSERAEYLQGMEMIPRQWSRVNFVGPIVSGQNFGCTTVWQVRQ